MSIDLAALEIDPSAAIFSRRAALPGPKAPSPFAMTRAVIRMTGMAGLSVCLATIARVGEAFKRDQAIRRRALPMRSAPASSVASDFAKQRRTRLKSGGV